MLQQSDTDDPLSDTTVLISLTFPDFSPLKDAMYHVHEGSMLEVGADCASLKSHFNPTVAAPCNRDPEQWATCELGDISGRHGPLTLPAVNEGRLFFTDTFLPLGGPYSMEDRSIVVHDRAGKRLACAALVLSKSPFKTAIIPGPDSKPAPRLGPSALGAKPGLGGPATAAITVPPSPLAPAAIPPAAVGKKPVAAGGLRG